MLMDLNQILGELGKKSRLETNFAADPRIFICQEVLGIGRDLVLLVLHQCTV